MASTDPLFYVKVVPVGGGEVRVDASDSVTSLTFEDDESKPDKLKLVVDNYDLRNFDAPIWRVGNRVKVSWGYPGNMSPERSCAIQKVTGSMVLNVECLDEVAAVMNKSQKVRTFERVRRSDVARQIAEEQGVTPDRMHVEDTEEVLEQVTQARMTDAQLLLDMAKREGFEFYTDFDGFHFHRRVLGQRPARRLHYFTDPGRGDVISWSIDNDIYGGGGKAGSVQVRGRDPMKKEDFQVEANNATATERVALAPVVGLVPEVNFVGGAPVVTYAAAAPAAGAASVVAPSSEPTKPSAQRQASGVYAKAQLKTVELTMEARGDPSVVGKTIIEVAGIGETLSGNYFVRTVTHKVGDGYRMSLKLLRDGKSSSASSGAGGAARPPTEKPGGPVNTQKPDDAEGRVLRQVVVFRDGAPVVVWQDARGREVAPP